MWILQKWPNSSQFQSWLRNRMILYKFVISNFKNSAWLNMAIPPVFRREDPPVVFVGKAGGSSRRICGKNGRILPSYLLKKREDPPVVFVWKSGRILPSYLWKKREEKKVPPVLERKEKSGRNLSTFQFLPFRPKHQGSMSLLRLQWHYDCFFVVCEA